MIVKEWIPKKGCANCKRAEELMRQSMNNSMKHHAEILKLKKLLQEYIDREGAESGEGKVSVNTGHDS